MSRTYRSNPSVKFNYESGVETCVQRGPWLITRPHFVNLSKGGWREAKRVLSKEKYAKLRASRGDKFTKDFAGGGVPHWYRNEIERQHRYRTKRELQRYKKNWEFEPMVNKKPSGVEYYYWY